MTLFPVIRDWIVEFLDDNKDMTASMVGRNMLIEQVSVQVPLGLLAGVNNGVKVIYRNKRSKNFDKRPNCCEKFADEENRSVRKSHCERFAVERQCWSTVYRATRAYWEPRGVVVLLLLGGGLRAVWSCISTLPLLWVVCPAHAHVT